MSNKVRFKFPSADTVAQFEEACNSPQLDDYEPIGMPFAFPFSNGRHGYQLFWAFELVKKDVKPVAKKV